MTPILGVGKIQIKHLLRDGESTNLNFNSVLEVPGKVDLNTDPLLGTGIEKFFMLHDNDFAKGFSNRLNKRLAWQREAKELDPNWNPKFFVVRDSKVLRPFLEN